MSDKYAALRQDILNPTIGSRDHLRKIALQLLDELAEREAEREADKKRIAELTEAEQSVKTLESRNCRLSGIIDTAERQISELRLALSRYSMSAGQADQRKSESIAVRTALGFEPDAEDVAPVDLCECIDALKTRVAELESRKVKLPSLSPQMFNDDVMFGYRKAQKEAVEFCAAADITLETGE